MGQGFRSLYDVNSGSYKESIEIPKHNGEESSKYIVKIVVSFEYETISFYNFDMNKLKIVILFNRN